MTLAPNMAYKVLVDGRSCHGGDMDWSLPTINDDGTYTPGEWMRVDGQLVLCARAIHLTDQPAAWYIDGAQCWFAEYRGDTVGKLTGSWESKIGVREARLIAPVPWEDVGVWSEGDHVARSGVVTASGSASVTAYDSASVRAYGSASVTAYGSASVRASGSASVTAYDSASVRASGSASVTASDSASVTASGSASVRAYGSASVTAYGSASVRAYGSASVTAYGSASVTAYGSASVTAYDSASVTAYDSASVTASDSASVTSQPWHSASAEVALSQMAAHIDRRGGKLVLRSAGGAA